MIGIYKDDFIDYLKEHLGDPIKITPKNIVCRCPWCERDDEKKHYHLWIGIDTPIFHCFHAGCEESGTIRKLVSKVSGSDSYDKYVDKDKVKESIKQKLTFDRNVVKPIELILPDLKETYFKYKVDYIRKRLKYTNRDLNTIKGLVFDIDEFIRVNNITIDVRLSRLKDFLQANFIGFVSENKSICMLRNIDPRSEFKHFKMDIQKSKFLDYYKLYGANKNSTTVVLAEGIFDIYAEHIFDKLDLKQNSKLYASGFSTSYPAMLKSIAYHEHVFRMDVHILSDSNVELKYYKQMRKYNSHLINSMTIYYNRMGKDFNDTPLVVEKFNI